MNIMLGILAGLLAIGFSQNASAQGVPSGNMQMAAQISEARKTNATLMRQYTWNCRTEVIENNEVKDTRIELVNYTPDGMLVRSILNDQSASMPRGFLRRAIAEDKKKQMEEYLTDLRGLIEQYANPTEGKILDFLNQATTSGPDSGGLFEMTGRSVMVPGDTFSMWTDARTRHTRKIQVSTNYKSDVANVTATFQTLNSGLAYMAYAEIPVPAKQLSVQVQNFNYTRSN
jgi:hypothetical protein